jgi:hypothetical protein
LIGKFDDAVDRNDAVAFGAFYKEGAVMRGSSELFTVVERGYRRSDGIFTRSMGR